MGLLTSNNNHHYVAYETGRGDPHLRGTAIDNAENSNVSTITFPHENPPTSEDITVWIAAVLVLIAVFILAVYPLYRRRA